MSSPVQALAELAVRVGVEVQPGQDVLVFGWDVEQAPIVRAVAEEAYARGARFVSALYWDQHVKRSRLLHARRGRTSGSCRIGGRQSLRNAWPVVRR